LIDEAQDTSPRQWDIVGHLISEFTTGAGARDGVRRTVFAVGDEKQSIFSFQGAAPDAFDAMRRSFAKRVADAGEEFAAVELDLAQEKPSSGWEAGGRRGARTIERGGSRGLVIGLVITLLAVAGGAAFVLSRAVRSWREPRGDGVAGASRADGAGALRSARADAGSRVVDARPLDGSARRDGRRDVALSGRRAPPAVPGTGASVPPVVVSPARGASGGRTSPPPGTPPPDARHVYWTESGPVLP